jgi:cytochrome c peroxidase
MSSKLSALVIRVLACLAVIPGVASPQNDPAARLKLGKALFYSSALSRDGTVSCASCHVPDLAYSDRRVRSLGIGGQPGVRNAPSIVYSSRLTPLFWDGRAPTLAEQILHPITSETEMGLERSMIGDRVKADQDLSPLHVAAFVGVEPSGETVASAIADYVASLAAFDSPFDRWRRTGAPLGRTAQSGLLLFMSKGKCIYCHFNSRDREVFTDMQFHNTGVAYDPVRRTFKDNGRSDITHSPGDTGKFRTPSLRNAALTAPYFHDGSAPTLMDVIDFYNKGGRANPGLDMLMVPLHLTAAEKRDLVAFLESLTDEAYRK